MMDAFDSRDAGSSDATPQDVGEAQDVRVQKAHVGVAQQGSIRPTRDRVYELVRQAILLGEYPGGTFIEEEIISTRASVSRTPVREAFHRLAAEQYIDLVPRKGALVRQVSPRELKGMYEARYVIESSVMELICRERIVMPPTIPDLVRQMGSIREITSPKAQLDFIELDWTFHSLVIAMSDNEVLIDLYRSMRSRFDRVFQTVRITPTHLQKVYSEHISILGLLQTFDIDALKETLKGHLKSS